MFSTLPRNHDVTLHTNDIDICKGELVESYHESWNEMVNYITEVVVMSTKPEQGVGANSICEFLSN